MKAKSSAIGYIIEWRKEALVKKGVRMR